VSARLEPPGACPACGADPRPGVRLEGAVQLRQCPRCLLAWWDWSAFDPAQFYDVDYFQSAFQPKGYDDYAGLEEGLARTARARLRRLARWGGGWSARRRLLEIGCGTGVFLDAARRAGWQTEGIEVSLYAAEAARRRGHVVSCQAAELVDLPAAAYDCVAMWDVLEHVRDPAGVLRRAAAALRPGGVLALSTGDVTSLCARLSGRRWHLYNLPEHLFFFSPTALRLLLSRAGCRVVRIAREVNWVPVGYLLERLRKSLLRPAPSRPRRVERRSGARFRPFQVVPATLGDVLGVYALRCGT